MNKFKDMSNEQKINSIINWFDWERVRQTMLSLNWKWACSETEDGIPTIGMMINRTRNMLLDCAKAYSQEYTIATGGFVARKTYYYPENRTDFSLEFVVAEWGTNDID